MTAKEVCRVLVGLGYNCLWDPRRIRAIPNSTIVGWEADLLVLQPSGWLWEIEIKVSVADFRREFKTKGLKHRVYFDGPQTEKYGAYYSHTYQNKHVQKFFFALLKAVYDRLRPEEFPEKAGIIVIDPAKTDHYGRPRATIVRKAKNLPGAAKVDDAFRLRFYELVYHRFWAFASRDEKLLDAKDEVG